MNKSPKCPRGMKVQSLLFAKEGFTKAQAKRWVKEHGYTQTYIDEKENTLRVRQEEPSSFLKTSFRVISFRPGVKAVIACPRKSVAKTALKPRKKIWKIT